MLMATKSAMPPKLFGISGLIPLTSTIFLWPSMLMAAILIVTGVLIAYLSAPSAEKARTAESYGLQWEPFQLELEPRTKPGEWLEYSPLLTILVVALLSVYLVDVFRTSPQGALAALDLNTFNLIFITAGLLLQWRPKRFLRAVMECVPGTAGVIIQFPLYAMIFGMIVGTGLSDKAARLLTSVSTHDTFALFVALYSATLGRLHSLRRKQVDYRSAVCSPGGHRASRESGMGGADLQRIGSAAEHDQPVLHAAAAWDLAPARPRSGGLRIAAVMVQAPYRVFPVLAIRAASAVHPADEMSMRAKTKRSKRPAKKAKRPIGLAKNKLKVSKVVLQAVAG